MVKKLELKIGSYLRRKIKVPARNQQTTCLKDEGYYERRGLFVYAMWNVLIISGGVS